jgi:phage terminase large subunit GpA
VTDLSQSKWTLAQQITAEAEEAEVEVIEGILAFRDDPCWHLATTCHKNDRGEPLTFDDPPRPCLIPFYKDNSKYMTVKSSTQSGKTERIIVLVMAMLKLGYSLFYIWPKGEARTSFMRRFERTIQFVDEYLQGLAEAPTKSDSAILKYLWGGQVKAVSSGSLLDMKEYPADMVIVEEFDQCHTENVEHGYHRIDYARDERKGIWKIGNPSVVGDGIDEEYQDSDQKVWMIECPECGKQQQLDWFVNVVEEVSAQRYRLLDQEWAEHCGRDIHVICNECEAILDRYSDGEWVPLNPGHDISGYHFNQLFSGNVKVMEMWKQFQKALNDNYKMQAFLNNCLGLGYEGAEAKLTKAILDACCDDYIMKSAARHTTAGIDVGSQIHMWVSDYPNPADPGIKRMLWAGTLPLKKQIILDKLKELGVDCVCIDSRPETLLAQDIREEYEGEVYLVQFHTQPTASEMKEPGDEDEEHLIKVDRTVEFDKSTARIVNSAMDREEGKTGHFIMPRNTRSADEGEVYAQLCAPKRVYDPDYGRRGNKGAYIWTENGKPDHYRLAEIYDCIAMRLRPVMAEIEVTGKREIQRGQYEDDMPVGGRDDF